MLTGRSYGRDTAHVRILDHDASGARLREAGEHPQQRRLATSRAAHQREHLALVDAQVDVLDGGEGAECSC